MKTCLFSTSWLEGSDYSGSPRLARTVRYLDYYVPLYAEIGFEDIWLCDNASSWESIRKLYGARVYRFDECLRKGEGYDYPYVWRGIYFLRELMRMGYEKVIYVETDAFIVSPRLADFIRDRDSGITTLWSPHWNFPAAEITVFCADAFPALLQYFGTPWQERNLRRLVYENDLPYTHVEKKFTGDRYGELGNPGQQPGTDYYTQAPLNTPLRFGGTPC